MEDFTNFFKGGLKDGRNEAPGQDFQNSMNDFENWKGLYQKIEKEYQYAITKTDQLQKYNDSLQDQVSKYAILHSEEKKEKQELLEKYDDLQKEYHGKVELLYREKSTVEKKYAFAV